LSIHIVLGEGVLIPLDAVNMH